MSEHKRIEKAKRYLALLDAARCNGKWQEVPELVRKVTKHAPERQCLCNTAQSERQLATRQSDGPAGNRGDKGTLQYLVPGLTTSIDKETSFPEDAYQAQACLGWLYWLEGPEHNASARSALPRGLPTALDSATEKPVPLGSWTYVCMVRSACLRGLSQDAEASKNEVLQSYEETLELVKAIPATTASSPQCQYWTKRYYEAYCKASYRCHDLTSRTSSKVFSPDGILAPFRAWATYLKSPRGNTKAQADESERQTWNAYYTTLSCLLKTDIQPTSQDHRRSRKTVGGADQDEEGRTEVKAQQLKEMKLVEQNYEELLLSQVSFPEAGVVNTEVERWADQVMQNWRTLCGPAWADVMGSKDKEASGRSVLNTLYRAATRTFHSTSILRHLFTIHASLAEFDLATNALNSYFEIVTRTQARMEKSGKRDQPGFDDDETVLRTTVEAIEFLCQYGGAKESEKAEGLAASLEKWLEKHTETPTGQPSEPDTLAEQARDQVEGPAGFIVAAVYRAIGISHAQWARHTFEAANRVEARQSALASLEKALDTSLGDEKRLDTFYALAFINAESRKIDAAIQYAKAALASGVQESSVNTLGSPVSRQRTNSLGTMTPNAMIKVYHLLALLLSARQEFEKALSFCEAALEDFMEENDEPSLPREQLARLTPSEKQDLIETKLTQISLIEILEGPETAVNATGELLGLYAALFNHVNDATEEATKTAEPQQQPPPTSRSTIRSLRGSIFSRSRDPSVNRQSGRAETVKSQRFSSEDTTAPTISVTDNDSSIMPPPSYQSQALTHSASKKLQKRNSRRSLASAKSRVSSAPRPQTATATGKTSTTRAVSVQNPSISVSSPPGTSNDSPRSERNSGPHEDIPLRPRTSPTARHKPTATTDSSHPPTIPHSQPSTNNFTTHPTTSSTTSPHPYPRPITPLFPPSTLHLHSLSTLLRIWLSIAHLYTTSHHTQSAGESLGEAFSQIEALELHIATHQSSSAQAFETPIPGPAPQRSLEQLWADVYAEQGHLRAARGDLRGAMMQFESALEHDCDHVGASVALAELLLDVYEDVIPPVEDPGLLGAAETSYQGGGEGGVAKRPPTLKAFPPPPPPPEEEEQEEGREGDAAQTRFRSRDQAQEPHVSKSPAMLDKLAARDRAYGLLDGVTKLGAAWDHSEAWMGLARAAELSGMVERAREMLWWVVELEGGRGVRRWEVVGGRGYL